MSTRFKHPKHLRHTACAALVAIAIAALGAGSASAAPRSPQARAAATKTTVCEPVTGDRWKIPGPGEPSGLGCKTAQLLANNLVLGSPGFKGFKCIRHKHFNGDCKRTIHRGRRRIVQVFGWYPDLAHPNGP